MQPERLSTPDAGELLTLQRAAYVTEARLHRDLDLPPLVQTLDELVAELADPDVRAWGLHERGRLVASVRVRVEGDAGLLARLMVAPDRQGHGLGGLLLGHAERSQPPGVRELRLFTGDRSSAADLYRRRGWVETHRTPAGTHDLVHFALRVPAGEPPSG